MQSTDLITPLAIGTPIAVSGDKNIPSQTASGTDTSSIAKGFLPITSEPLDDGGIAPERTDFNGMFYLATDQRVFLQNGGFITYSEDVVTSIGGYPKDAILGYINPTGNFLFVKSLVENNAYNFVETPAYIDGTYWEYASLNVDLSNALPAQSFIDTVMNWGMPDYSAGISISYGYTAPSVGICYITGYSANSLTTLTVNGITVGYVGYHDGNYGSITIPVNKGDKVSASSKDGSWWFFPLKGVTNV